MTLVWRPGFQFDADASTYIEAVEAADGQALETGVRYAINDFVIGCKNDGIWDAIKASCILAGARTLDGALVPLAGTAPTNYNFVSGDYDRETGLVGDGSTKYLDSNRADNASPQNSFHGAVYITDYSPGGDILSSGLEEGCSVINLSSNFGRFVTRSRANVSTDITVSAGLTGLLGHSRGSSGEYAIRAIKQNFSAQVSSQPPTSATSLIFKRPNASFYSDARLSFYSIGESLDLAALDARVSDLITAIGAAIP